jgi:hypothetical protein
MTKFSTRLRTVALLAAGVLVTTGITPISQTPADATAQSCADAHSAGVVAPAADSDGVYIIDTVGKLVWLSENFDEEIVAGGQEWREASFLQTEDLELAGCLFAGLGPSAFEGHYDGGGNTISDLVMDRNVVNTGLFPLVANDGVISNVHIVNADVKGANRTGALAGQVSSSGRVKDSSVSGVVTVFGANLTGGLVGEALGGILRSEVTGTVTVTGGNNVGGLAGRARVEIRDSFVSGTTEISGSNTVGGLVGDGTSTQIEASFVGSGVRVVGSGNPVGGLVAEYKGTSTTTAVIERSFSAADVTGAYQVGGLVGDTTGSTAIVASFATGDVVATGDSSASGVGGLVGRFDGHLTDSYATGSIRASDGNEDSSHHGGLVGAITGSNALIATSYAIGSVTGPDAPTTGGLAGAASGPSSLRPAESSFWNTQTSGQERSATGIGIGKTTEQLTNIATFTGATPAWNIVDGWAPFDLGAGNVWGICPALNDGYPFLLWEYTSAQVPAACGGTAPGGETVTADATPTTPVLNAGGLPSLTAGQAVWQIADGSQVPLAVSSPGANQVRYSADGVTVTFTGGAGTSVSNGLVANPAGEVACEVCLDLATGNVIEVWMFSTPRLVAAHRIDAEPCQQFAIPVVAPLDGGGPVSAGAHTLQLALPTASGMQAVNVGVTVGGPVPASVPAGEGPTVPLGLLALGLLASAGAVVAARRQVVAG